MAPKLLLIAVCLAYLGLANGEPKLRGENLCNKTILVKKDKTIQVPVKYEIKYDTTCGILPCQKTKTELRMDSKLITITEEVQVATCCPGYAETPSRRCAPICFDSCNNGKCFLPNVCKCDPEPTERTPGYVGTFCNRYTCLATNRWGANCDKECSCGPNSYCSASNGKCLCRSGWRGANCTEECDSRSRCDDVELPPVIDPEANVIDDNLAGSSMHLDALSMERTMDRDGFEQKSVTSLIAAHMGVNLILIVLTTVLVAAIFWYRKRLDVLRNELYYTTYSPGSSSDGSSTYTSGSNYVGGSLDAEMQKRPRMPTPLESNYLSKNMSFASASKNLLSGGIDIVSASKQDGRHKYILTPRVESHLANSQKSSEQNIYSDIESVLGQSKSTSTIPEESVLNVTSSLASSDSPYQVPKPLSKRSIPIPHPDNEYEIDLDQSNVYEEIKPKLQPNVSPRR